MQIGYEEPTRRILLFQHRSLRYIPERNRNDDPSFLEFSTEIVYGVDEDCPSIRY